MKNIRMSQLKKCIFLSEDEFAMLLEELYNTSVSIGLDDGLYYEASVEINNIDLFEKLKDYFDVSEICSIHADSAEYMGIWICYQE